MEAHRILVGFKPKPGPNHGQGAKVRSPGIEPGPSAWKADILTTELRALVLKTEAFDGIRTRDLSLTKRVLCQLSYEGTKKWRIRVSIPVPRRC